ncbi:MAG: polymerase III subunit beta protein [Candidatus Roizmanbacteria bacterium GW2011_GWA2_35_8]|uniref:Polymerase III subunit beta protein n=1 Tax=Candidatus Roizmanbacteria bacterium GW2011_GWA2_35_8 TaxID=1618479 RepID=A0A0G0CV52_9BACT|nr:MAG: polymerase III subunit beta protein [Candidatus Roizmanbacteria bacterium GW2011_GWA2_35_8]
MKISLLRDVFLKKINNASKFTSSRLSSSAMLQGIYMICEENIINFYSTNLNYYYHTSLKLKESAKFKLLVEPKKISEFLSLINTEKIDIEIKEKLFIIESGKTKAEFPLYESIEFPFPPKITSSKQKMKTDFLRENVPFLLFSSSSDDTRPVLTGINFVVEDDALKLVSTDGFRLSLLNLKKEIEIPSMIVPAGFLMEAVRLFDEDEISLSYSPEEKVLALSSDEHDLYTRLIEGDYPPFERVIPSSKKTTIELDREDFLRNVKLTSIFARDQSSVIVLKTEKDGVYLSPKTGENQGNITYQEAKIEGEAQKIAFNFKFLLDLLNNSKSKKVIIELLRGDAPALFRLEGVNNFIHIIMPVRIQE